MSNTQGPEDERRRSEAEPARTAGSGTTSHDPLGDPRSSATPDGLGALLAALAAPPEAQELAGEHAMVAAFSEALAGAPGLAHAVGTSSKRRRKMLGKVLTAKAAAAAVAAVLLGSGVAAATGSLPASLQMAVHRALGAPAPHAHAKVAAHASAKGSTSLATTTQGGSTTTTSSGQMGTTTTTTTSSSGSTSTNSSTTTTTSNGVGPAVPGPSTRGLCVAVLASGRATAQVSAKEPTAFRNLEAAATAKGESVSAYCATVLQGSTTGSSTTSSSPVTSSATTTGSSSSTSSPGASGSAGSSATLHAHGSASGSTSGSSLPTQASGNANLGASVSAGASGRAFGRSHSPLAGLAG